jgi:hypothetical protein
MTFFDNIYILFTVTILLSIYLTDTIYKVKIGVPGNIYEEWQQKYNSHLETPDTPTSSSYFTEFVFKKHGPIPEVPKDKLWKDDFIDFVTEMRFYYNVFCLTSFRTSSHNLQGETCLY